MGRVQPVEPSTAALAECCATRSRRSNSSQADKRAARCGRAPKRARRRRVSRPAAQTRRAPRSLAVIRVERRVESHLTPRDRASCAAPSPCPSAARALSRSRSHASASLIFSKVVLSFGIPFALAPLVWLCDDRSLTGGLQTSPPPPALRRQPKRSSSRSTCRRSTARSPVSSYIKIARIAALAQRDGTHRLAAGTRFVRRRHRPLHVIGIGRYRSMKRDEAPRMNRLRADGLWCSPSRRCPVLDGAD